jgi:hypothetical protein
MGRYPSLRMIVLAASGQDVRKCCNCELCGDIACDDQDVPLEMLVQWVLYDDERVLTCRTLWSDQFLRRAQGMCTSNLDIEALFTALRVEAQRRGLHSNGDRHGK